MSYAFIDGYGSVLQSEASIVSGGAYRQNVAIASFLTAIPTTITGNPSISGGVTIVGGVQTSVTGGISSVGQVGNWHFQPASVQVLGGIGVIGSVATLQGTSPWRTVASISGGISSVSQVGQWNMSPASVQLIGGTNIIGSVATLQGTNPWQVNQVGNASVYTLPYNEQRTSIISVGSTLNAGDAASVLVFAAAGASSRNYITDIAIANTGSVATLITFTEGGGSILGKTIAPATGGSNIIGMTIPWRNQKQNQPVNLVVGTASSTVHYTVTGYQAP